MELQPLSAGNTPSGSLPNSDEADERSPGKILRIVHDSHAHIVLQEEDSDLSMAEPPPAIHTHRTITILSPKRQAPNMWAWENVGL